MRPVHIVKDHKKLLIATGSSHKFGELRDLLDLPKTELLSLPDLGITDSPEENGHTFEDNAVLKAIHYARETGLPTLADDSGIEVDALGGRPGVKTRRYAGPNATGQIKKSLSAKKCSHRDTTIFRRSIISP